jgi:hypothetical protein
LYVPGRIESKSEEEERIESKSVKNGRETGPKNDERKRNNNRWAT